MKNILIISDSTGDTAEQYISALLANFNTEEVKIFRHININTEKKIDEIFDNIPPESMIFTTIANSDLMKYVMIKALDRKIDAYDLLFEYLMVLEDFLGQKAKRKAGLSRQLNKDYFDRIAAIEFAVKYDDGKDPRGVHKADIVLIGVSRTSKTPVSMTLAHKGIKVCNIPLVPELEAPKELFEVDPNKVIGLIINPKKLIQIRMKRLESLGLKGIADYAEIDRINEELRYALKIIERIGCKKMDVTNKTITETANLILEHIIR